MHPTKGWSKQSPSRKERRKMMKSCGKSCFLGPKLSFPICIKNSCKKSRKGILSAYIRAKEYETIKGTRKYSIIANKARKMLNTYTKI
jgi:hypothetical protein